MIRHSKENMKNIPKPTWKKTLLEMNTTEKSSYNAIVALAKSNLVTTGGEIFKINFINLLIFFKFIDLI